MQTFTGLEYINIAIANAWGMDKVNWETRLAAVDGLLEENPADAKEPALFIKAIKAREDALAGIPTGYIMSADATASGIQIIAALTGCIESAKKVNLVNTGSREDVYTFLGDKQGISRSEMKSPTMTIFYGSVEEPKKVFGEDTEELKQFYTNLQTELPGCMDYLNFVSKCWNPEATHYTWTLPDGHTAHVAVTAMVDKKIEVQELNKSTFTFRTEEVCAQKKGRSLQANLVQSFDSWVVREMYKRCALDGFEILTIHDSL